VNASGEIYEGPRLVLRQRKGSQTVTELAAAADWTLLADNSGENYAQYTREQTWGVRRGVHVHAVIDSLSEYCSLTVLAEDRLEGEQFTSQLEEYLNPLTRDELLAPVTEISDAGERMLHLMRLAVGSPAAFDREIHVRITEFARDEDPRVRDATTLAMSYVAWPQFRPVLQDLATNDPNPTVRQDAAAQLQMYDDSGVPQE
jgi:HEAT repeat protein